MTPTTGSPFLPKSQGAHPPSNHCSAAGTDGATTEQQGLSEGFFEWSRYYLSASRKTARETRLRLHNISDSKEGAKERNERLGELDKRMDRLERAIGEIDKVKERVKSSGVFTGFRDEKVGSLAREIEGARKSVADGWKEVRSAMRVVKAEIRARGGLDTDEELFAAWGDILVAIEEATMKASLGPAADATPERIEIDKIRQTIQIRKRAWDELVAGERARMEGMGRKMEEANRVLWSLYRRDAKDLIGNPVEEVAKTEAHARRAIESAMASMLTATKARGIADAMAKAAKGYDDQAKLTAETVRENDRRVAGCGIGTSERREARRTAEEEIAKDKRTADELRKDSKTMVGTAQELERASVQEIQWASALGGYKVWEELSTKAREAAAEFARVWHVCGLVVSSVLTCQERMGGNGDSEETCERAVAWKAIVEDEDIRGFIEQTSGQAFEDWFAGQISSVAGA